MLGATTIPERPRAKRWHFIRDGAEALGHLDRFDSIPQAVRLGPDYRPLKLDDPTDEIPARRSTKKCFPESRACYNSIRSPRRDWTFSGSSDALSHPSAVGKPPAPKNDRSLDR